MSLQLYQVDQRSYLLDFKSLTGDCECRQCMNILPVAELGSRHASMSGQDRPHLSSRDHRAYSLPSQMDASPPPSPGGSSQEKVIMAPSTMLFFEKCAALIGTLAR